MKRNRFWQVFGGRGLTAALMGSCLMMGCSGSSEEAAETIPDVAGNEVTQDSAPPAQDPAASSTSDYASYDPPYDENAVYTLADVPDRGNYLKVNLSNMNEDQINSAVHQFKTTLCPCQGCTNIGMTVDRCLVLKPECLQGLQKASQIAIAVRAMD